MALEGKNLKVVQMFYYFMEYQLNLSVSDMALYPSVITVDVRKLDMKQKQRYS